MFNPIQNVRDQFKTPKIEDFPGVLVPLADAPRHHSVTSNASKFEKFLLSDKKKDSGGDRKKDSSDDEFELTDRTTNAYSAHTMEGLRNELDNNREAFGTGTPYDRKAKLFNIAIQDIGMGWYQWQLFVLCGFGWFADNFWLQGIALTLPQVSKEFDISETHVRFTTMSVFIGLTLGASFWGIASDVIGRRFAFNTTLFICAVFGTAAGGAPNWITLCALVACMGVGVGGNLPVDGALFLEFLPFASGSLLTGLSVWWPVGSMVAALIGWGLIPNFSCASTATCTEANNMGWRYLLFTMGGLTMLQWGCRFFIFRLYESPKFLLSRGRQAEAVAVVHAIAYKNGTKTWLSEEIIEELAGDLTAKEDTTKLSRKEIVKRALSKFSVDRVKPLFHKRDMAITVLLLWFQWATIGMAYPLFNAYLPQFIGANTPSIQIQYRNYAITNVVGVPGSIIAIWTVNLDYIGRKGTMAFATMLTGVLVFLFTTSKDPNIQLAISSLESCFQNVMYGVLYAYTPEVFPAPQRGTGTGISSCFNRLAGVCAPLVAIYGATTDPTTPIYASGGLFIAAFISMIFLPIETRDRQSL